MFVKLYWLDNCGFFKRGENSPEFGTINEWWDEFSKWIEKKQNVPATATFDYDVSNVRRVYCTATTSDSVGNIGVALWNETPSGEDGIDYISISSQVGDVTAKQQQLPEESIPGWPTYLWFMPDEAVVVSLVPDNMQGFRSTGLPQAREYFRSYLDECCQDQAHSSLIFP